MMLSVGVRCLYTTCVSCLRRGSLKVFSNVSKVSNDPLTVQQGRYYTNSGRQGRYGQRIKVTSCIGVSAVTCSTYYALKYQNNIKGFLETLGIPPVYAEDMRSSKRFNFIADAVELSSPAVVCITVNTRAGIQYRMMQGSGFIIKSDGLILTNAHVVGNNSVVEVKLQDGRLFQGHVLVTDPVTDLATVKIHARDLPTLPLGNSNDLRPGEWVIAMGSPLSLKNTVTAGIVSSVHRACEELGKRNKGMEYIQTDAIINVGNSGGPLINLDGEAIGINTMKVVPGISFAIPSDKAKEFLARAERYTNRVKSKTGTDNPRGRYFGFTMLTLTPEIISELQGRSRFPDGISGGILVTEVYPNSPAFIAGLQVGDIIQKINGKDVTSVQDLYQTNLDTLTLTVQRQSHTLVFNVRPVNLQS